MSDLTKEQKLKHLQLALSMVGISANLMTCELIQAMAEMVDEKGLDFSLRDANELAASIQKKYQTNPVNPMAPPENLVKERKLFDDASVIE